MSAAFPILYPAVSKILEPTSLAVAQFVGSRPQGVLVHYTADRDSARARRTLVERQLGYHLVIERCGAVTQLCYLDRRVDHAGPSLWRGLSCNRWFAAVALVSWGELSEVGRAWNGAQVAPAETAVRPYNIGARRGRWDIATPEQEASLVAFLRWAVGLGVDPRNVAGHDEAAIPPGRKVDPGGVLSMEMHQLREVLCAERGIEPDITAEGPRPAAPAPATRRAPRAPRTRGR